MNTTTKVIIGITLAAGAGAVAGMLMAPEKGSDLQKKLRENAKGWLTEFMALLNSAKELATETSVKGQASLPLETSENDPKR